MASTASLRLALRYICMQSRPLCQEHSLPTWRHPCVPIELRGTAAKVSWVIFCSGGLLGCLEIQNGHKHLEWHERPRVVSFHSNRSNPVEVSSDVRTVYYLILQSSKKQSSRGLNRDKERRRVSTRGQETFRHDNAKRDRPSTDIFGSLQVTIKTNLLAELKDQAPN